MSVATLKDDVYSYGILVLEIISGLRPCETIMDEEISRKEMSFRDWIHGRFAHAESGCVEQAMQRLYRANQMTVSADEDVSVAAELIRVAFRCVNDNPDERPSMHEVYKWLRKIAEKYSAISDEDEEVPLMYSVKQNTCKKYC